MGKFFNYFIKSIFSKCFAPIKLLGNFFGKHFKVLFQIVVLVIGTIVFFSIICQLLNELTLPIMPSLNQAVIINNDATQTLSVFVGDHAQLLIFSAIIFLSLKFSGLLGGRRHYR